MELFILIIILAIYAPEALLVLIYVGLVFGIALRLMNGIDNKLASFKKKDEVVTPEAA